MLDRRTLDAVNSAVKEIDSLQEELDKVMSANIRIAYYEGGSSLYPFSASQEAERAMKTAAKNVIEDRILSLKNTLRDKFNVKV